MPIRRWQKWASEKELHLWLGFLFLRRSGKRQKAIYGERQKALAALVQAMLHHLNLVTHKVEASIEMLSDECGLSTTSTNGNKSICRASRLISELLVPAGCINIEKAWDRHAGKWIASYIEVNEKFFEMIGLDYQYVEKEQHRYIDFAKTRLMKLEDVSNMSISQLKRVSRRHHVIRAKATIDKRRDIAKKARLEAQLKESREKHGYATLDTRIAFQMLQEMTDNELSEIDSKQLRKRVNQRKRYYEEIISS